MVGFYIGMNGKTNHMFPPCGMYRNSNGRDLVNIDQPCKVVLCTHTEFFPSIGSSREGAVDTITPTD